MYLCVAVDNVFVNGYEFGQGTLVEVKYINVEVGKRAIITFVDMFGNWFTLDAKAFYKKFRLDKEGR